MIILKIQLNRFTNNTNLRLLTDYLIFFENNDSFDNEPRLIGNDYNYNDAVLEYIEYNYEEDLLFLDLNGMKTARINKELISILNTEEFIFHINATFQEGVFKFIDGKLIYLPYIIEKETLQINLEFQEESDLITSGRNLQSPQTSWIRAETRWWWLGLWNVELNDMATQQVIRYLNTASSSANFISRFVAMIPKAGAILRTVLRIIAIYLRVISTIIWLNNFNNRNDVIIRAFSALVLDVNPR